MGDSKENTPRQIGIDAVIRTVEDGVRRCVWGAALFCTFTLALWIPLVVDLVGDDYKWLTLACGVMSFVTGLITIFFVMEARHSKDTLRYLRLGRILEKDKQETEEAQA